jgi:hypothetical protein
MDRLKGSSGLRGGILQKLPPDCFHHGGPEHFFQALEKLEGKVLAEKITNQLVNLSRLRLYLSRNRKTIALER